MLKKNNEENIDLFFLQLWIVQQKHSSTQKKYYHGRVSEIFQKSIIKFRNTLIDKWLMSIISQWSKFHWKDIFFRDKTK